MVTIKDVAEKAGVSITTVSHVINETRYVSDALTERVAFAMRELNYRPNIVARSLRSGRTKTIGLVIPDISNPFFAEFSRKIEDKGFEYGYNVILCNTDEDRKKEEIYVDVLISKQVDGLIFLSAGDTRGIRPNPYMADIPMVITDREAGGIASDVVLIDNELGGYQATQYLLSLGHRRIGCIAGPFHIRAGFQRVQGYRKALEEAGVDFDEALVSSNNFRFDGGERGMQTLMALSDPPTAVFASNDMMALGAMRAIIGSGMRVPEDYSIVGFDNTPLGSLVSPELTTVSQPIKAMADLSVELLIEKINLKEEQKRQKDLKPIYQRIVLNTELVERGSCQTYPSQEVST